MSRRRRIAFASDHRRRSDDGVAEPADEVLVFRLR